MQAKIYHNPKCSKSRATLALLSEQNIDVEIIDYLTNPPSHTELDFILRRLELEPRDFMRTKEAPYAEQDLDDASLSRDQLIQAMVDHPILIERPIVIVGNRVAIGRPPENVLNIID